MKQFKDSLVEIMDKGEDVHDDRTSVGTRNITGFVFKHNMAQSFPLPTVRRINYKSGVAEALWMMSGSSNAFDMHKYGAKFWDSWADKEGHLGYVYGKLWRDYPIIKKEVERTVINNGLVIEHTLERQYEGIDQLSNAVEELKVNPSSRRIMVNAWHVDPEIRATQALPACHFDFQFVVLGGKLSCNVYMRSLDVPVGLYFDLMLYQVMSQIIAYEVGLELGTLTIFAGIAHIYHNQFDAVDQMLQRDVIDCAPQLILRNTHKDIFSYKPEDFILEGYESHPHIDVPVAV